LSLCSCGWQLEEIEAVVGPVGQEEAEGLAGQEEAKGSAGQEEADGRATLLIRLTCERLRPSMN